MVAAGVSAGKSIIYEQTQRSVSLSFGDYIWQHIKQPGKLQRAAQAEAWKMHLPASGRLVLKIRSLEMGCGSRICTDHSLQTDSIVCLKTLRQQFLAGRELIYL